MVLAFFIYKIEFDNRIDYENCYDNGLYNRGKVRRVPIFEAYDMTAKLGMIYADITKYSNLLLSGERPRLLAGNRPREPKTAAEQTHACEEALNNLVLQTWPNNGLASLKFPITWRQRLAKVVFQITSVEQLQKELFPSCLLYFLAWTYMLIN